MIKPAPKRMKKKHEDHLMGFNNNSGGACEQMRIYDGGLEVLITATDCPGV
jgi:hypothetical protein